MAGQGEVSKKFWPPDPKDEGRRGDARPGLAAAEGREGDGGQLPPSRPAEEGGVHSGGADAYLFEPVTNYRTLEFAKPLSTRMVQKIVKRWAVYCKYCAVQL